MRLLAQAHKVNFGGVNGSNPKKLVVDFVNLLDRRMSGRQENQIRSSARESFEDLGNAGQLEDGIDTGRSGPALGISSKLNALSITDPGADWLPIPEQANEPLYVWRETIYLG